jgi:hypothetical protein
MTRLQKSQKNTAQNETEVTSKYFYIYYNIITIFYLFIYF